MYTFNTWAIESIHSTVIYIQYNIYTIQIAHVTQFLVPSYNYIIISVYTDRNKCLIIYDILAHQTMNKIHVCEYRYTERKNNNPSTDR